MSHIKEATFEHYQINDGSRPSGVIHSKYIYYFIMVVDMYKVSNGHISFMRSKNKILGILEATLMWYFS